MSAYPGCGGFKGGHQIPHGVRENGGIYSAGQRPRLSCGTWTDTSIEVPRSPAAGYQHLGTRLPARGTHWGPGTGVAGTPWPARGSAWNQGTEDKLAVTTKQTIRTRLLA